MRIALLGVGLLVLWQVGGMLLLVFSACLVAVVLNALSRSLGRFTHISHGYALAITVIAILLALVAAIAFLGVQIRGDFEFLVAEVPKTLDRELGRIGIDTSAIDLGKLDSGSWTGMLGGLANYTGAAVSIAMNTFLVVVGGVFLAAQPRLYRRIVVYLFPKRLCRTTLSVLNNTGAALRRWMLGQLLLMAGIGVITTAGLMLIGVPSALGLGILAAFLEFIPVAGPVIAAVPGVLVGFSNGFEVGLWTLALYVGVQQIESSFVIPMVQRRTVSLAPALGLLSIIVFGFWFGALGIMLSAPLAVFLQVIVAQLYSRDLLGWKIKVPGATHA